MRLNPLLLSLASGAPVSQRLFALLPERIFSPLASSNRQLHWALLCALHHRRFGPDAPVPPSTGFPAREILADIEEELRQVDAAWEAEAGDAPEETEAEVNWALRSANVFNRFKDAGWLRVERYGVREMVSMRPAVTQFLNQLVAFAEKGPVFLRGKVRSIDGILQQVLEGEAEGDSVGEAADQARRLLEHVASAGTNVRDLIDSFGTEIPTAEFVRQFCSVYIERFFIGDYSELRNAQDHPLAKQQSILDAAVELRHNSAVRSRLLQWYEAKRSPDDKAKALRLYERDIDRILELMKLDEHLQRLDAEVRRANRKATAFLDYRLRSPRPVEGAVKAAIKNLLDNPNATVEAPFAPVSLMSELRIREPKVAAERPPAGPLRSSRPSIETVARRNVLVASAERRRLSSLKVATYLAQHLSEKGAASFAALTVNSVEELTVLQFLLTRANEARRGSVHHLFLGATRFEVPEADAEEQNNGFVTSRPFTLVRNTREQKKGTST